MRFIETMNKPKSLALVIMFVVLCAVGSAITYRNVTNATHNAITHNPSSNRYRSGLLNVPEIHAPSGMPLVIVVSGSNYEMGYQYGLQAAPVIYQNLVLFKSRLLQAYGEETVIKDMRVWAYYLEKYDPGLKDWLEGIRDGCRERGFDVNYLDLVALTCYPAEMWCRPSVPYPPETGVMGAASTSLSQSLTREMPLHCTAFAATGSATKDGKPIVAITKMVPTEVMQTLILIAFPDEGYSFIANPYAGAVVQNSGMNSAGFAWVLTAILGPPIWGVVTEVYFHYLTQYCGSPDEAIEYLISTPRAGVTGTFVMSASNGSICVFESNSQVFAIRKPGDAGEDAPFLVQTNHFIHPELRKHNVLVPGIVWQDSLYRYATAWKYVSEAARRGAIDFEFAKKMFMSDDYFEPKDWYNPEAGGQWRYNVPGSPNVLNNFPASVAQSIFFPLDRIAYFQVGTPSGIGLPAGATGEYVKFQLTNDIVTLVSKADEITFGLYSEARNLFQAELNRKAPYLTDSVIQSIKEMLDKAMLEYEHGMIKAAHAYLAMRNLGSKAPDVLALWSEVLTHYAHAQLYAQMVTTRLKNLRAS